MLDSTRTVRPMSSGDYASENVDEDARAPKEQITSVIDTIFGLDRTIHEPSRMAVMNVLARLGPTDYREMSRITGLSRANLSNHLARLRRVDLVSVEKETEGMALTLTEKGSQSLQDYYNHLSAIASTRGFGEAE